ncbi:MAG: ATP-binding protein [Halobacteriota archaeon]
MAKKKQTNVLLVEDNPSDARLVQDLLRDAQHERFTVIIAPTLSKGLDQVSRDAFDVILLDLGLPDSQGLDTFHAVHEHALQLPIVVLTVSDDEELGRKAVQEGAQGFLLKDVVLVSESYAGISTRMIRHAIEQKRAEAAFNASEEQFRTLFNDSPVAQVRYDADGRPVEANKAAYTFLGISSIADIQDWTIFTSPRVSDLGKAQLRGGRSIRYELCYDFAVLRESNYFPTSHSSVRYADIHTAPLFNAEGSVAGYLAQIIDITDSKNAAEERDSIARFPEENPDPVLRIGSAGQILYANAAAEALLQALDHRKDDAIPTEWMTSVDETYRRRKLLTEDIMAASRVFQMRFVPVPDESYVNVYGMNITALKQAEKALEDAQHLAGVGETAAMIGHDLRNPLQVLQYIVDLQKLRVERLSPDQRNSDEWKKQAQLFDKISEQVFYMDKIVGDLQDYARPITPEYEALSVGKLINDVLESTPHAESVRIATDIPDLQMMADPHLMHRVFANLILNALQAMPEGGTLTIIVSAFDHAVVINVHDTGVGILEEMKDKLFSPLITGKAKGTGLGLAVVKRIVDAHGGTIAFESEAGKGTTFTVRLPLSS